MVAAARRRGPPIRGALLSDSSPSAHAAAASALAEHVDALVRTRLAGTALLPRRPGRRTLPELWLVSLVAADPWLPASVDPDRARTLAHEVSAWVASGRVASGRLGVCLRIHEPPDEDDQAGVSATPPVHAADGPPPVLDPWRVEVLVADADDVGMRTPLSTWWPDASRYGAEAGRTLLADLARTVRVAPELAGLLDAPVPTGVAVDDRAVAALLSEHVEPLTEMGVSVLLPAWWTGRSRVGLRARARTRRSSRGDQRERWRRRPGGAGRLPVGGGPG